MADQKLSALSAALVASGNDLFYMVTTAGVSQKIPFNTLKTSLSLPAYAGTGNKYVVTDLAGDLTAELRLVQSGNSITIDTSGNLIIINAATGNLSTKQDLITYPLGINSGGTGITSGSATTLIGFNSSGASSFDTYRLAASDNITILRVGTAFFFSANTGTGASTGGVVYAPTGGFFVTWSSDTLLASEKILTASDNIVVTTGANNIWISATTAASGITAAGGSNNQIQVNSQNALKGYADFYWDEANFTLGIGANTTNQVAIGVNSPNPQIVITASNGQASNTLRSTNGFESDFIGQSANGTFLVPTSSGPTDTVLLIEGRAHDGVQYLSVAGIEFKMDGLVKASSLASCIEFWTNPGISGDVKAMILDRYKDLKVGRGLWVGGTGGSLISSSSAGYIYAINAANSDTTLLFTRSTSSRSITFPDSSGTVAVAGRYPILFSSGGNLSIGTGSVGQVLITSGGVTGDVAWVNTLGGAAGAVYAPTGGFYATWSSDTLLSNEKVITAGSSVTITTDATAIYINAITSPAGAGGTQTIRIPMALLSVQVNAANAFYTAKSGTQMDAAHVSFVDSAIGVATYWCEIPNNVNSTENWNLFFKHEPDSGAGGNVALTLCGQVLSDGSVLDANTTVLISARSFPTYAFGTLAVTSAATGVMDNTLGLAANQTFYVRVQRLASNSGDTVDAIWNMKSLLLQMNVDS